MPADDAADRPDPVKLLGALMRARREALGLSQEEAAGRAGLDRSHYSNIERGESKPGYPTLLAIAAALRMRFSQLQLAVEAIHDGDANVT
jgi:transcriptional regulator with XRE-family HTH domain